MKPLTKTDVVGQRVCEVIVAKPDRPVSMADQSFSGGFVRLENGVLIDLDALDTNPSDENPSEFERKEQHEKTFCEIIGEKVSDLVMSDEFGGVCVVLESGHVVAIVPGQFWIAPFLYSKEAFPLADAVSLWPH